MFKHPTNYADIEELHKHGAWPDAKIPDWVWERAEAWDCSPSSNAIVEAAMTDEIARLRAIKDERHNRPTGLVHKKMFDQVQEEVVRLREELKRHTNCDEIRKDFDKCSRVALLLNSFTPNDADAFVGTISEQLARGVEKLRARVEAAEDSDTESVALYRASRDRLEQERNEAVDKVARVLAVGNALYDAYKKLLPAPRSQALKSAIRDWKLIMRNP